MNVYEIVTERIIKNLESGVVPWKQPWRNDGTVPANLVSKKPYRGMNLFLLPRHYSTNWFVSFKQAQDLGGMVKRGEHGHMAIFWRFNNQPTKDGTETETEKTEKIPPILRYYTVFNVDQTTIPIEKIPNAPKMNDIPPIVACENVVSNMPNRPTIQENEARAYYQPAGDYINMPKRGLFNSPENWYNTLFHEIGHSTGHRSRLARHEIAGKQHGFGSKSYSREELVAEMSAAFLCGHCGIDTATVENSASYVQSWINCLREDKRAVVIAASQAQKAADYVLGLTA